MSRVSECPAFPSPEFDKKPQHDTCQKPLKHRLALTLSTTQGRVGLQDGWEIKLNILSFLGPFASTLNSHLVHQMFYGTPPVFELLLSQWLTHVLHVN